MKAQNNRVHRKQLLNDSDILLVKSIVDDNPNLYLDEISFLFGMNTGNFVHHITIRRCLVDKLYYSMTALQIMTRQQCEEDKTHFIQAMEIYLQPCLDCLITIDETRKDWNASRRRRGWDWKGNVVGVTVNAWFQNAARYTLIAAADVNEFIPVECHTVSSDEISGEGAAGTVDEDYFLYWVKEYLCPVLESYE